MGRKEMGETYEGTYEGGGGTKNEGYDLQKIRVVSE